MPIRPNDAPLVASLKQKLATYSNHDLPGIDELDMLDCFIEQIVDSVRRIKYVKTILSKNLSPAVADVSSPAFDPLKAAVWHIRQNDFDEAFWLVFLATHFGKNKRTGWGLMKAVYGALGNQQPWTWKRTSANSAGFCQWLQTNNSALKRSGKFGNHRKYESLAATTPRGTGGAVTTYIDWVTVHTDHKGLINDALAIVGNNPRTLFSFLYKSMSSVMSFGRTGKFDYLTMVGKLGLADIEPDSTYMNGATGPFRGAGLLFDGNKNTKLSKAKLGIALGDLETHLGLYFGMQVLEDSLCNWQKSPSDYYYFSG